MRGEQHEIPDGKCKLGVTEKDKISSGKPTASRTDIVDVNVSSEWGSGYISSPTSALKSLPASNPSSECGSDGYNSIDGTSPWKVRCASKVNANLCLLLTFSRRITYVLLLG